MTSLKHIQLKAKAKKRAKKLPSSDQISYTMSRVRSSGSAIEKRFGKALWQSGLRYRKQYSIFGKPDFVLVSRRIAIFCDSEFWHGYRWGKRRQAEHKTNQPYWFAKIERNRTRDRLVNRKLATAGWKVLRFWEREILDDLDLCVTKVMALIQQP